MVSDEAAILVLVSSKLQPLYVDRIDVKKRLDAAIKNNYATKDTHQINFNNLIKFCIL